MQTHKDYRVDMVADLIRYLKDYNYNIKPLEMAENIVKLIDEIHGKEYANKIKYQVTDYRTFSGKV